MTPEQRACAAKGHEPWVIATRTITAYDGMIPVKSRVRYCTGCDLDRPSKRPAVPTRCPHCDRYCNDDCSLARAQGGGRT